MRPPLAESYRIGQNSGMVAISDVRDEGSFRAWLEETNQPREVCIALAYRAAMRILPAAWAYAIENHPRLAINILRTQLVAGVAASAIAGQLTREDHDRALREAAKDASYNAKAASAVVYERSTANYYRIPVAIGAAAWATARAADGAFSRDADTAAAADAVREADIIDGHWVEISRDCETLAAGKSLNQKPLFHGLQPNWEIEMASLSRLGKEWSFWIEWYRDALFGNRQNSEMLLEIATTEDIDWQAPDTDINARIAEIVAKYEGVDDGTDDEAILSDENLAAAADAYPLGESIIRDEQGFYVAIPETEIPEGAFDLAKRRAQDTAEDMREDIRRSNHLRGLEKVCRNVERELERSSDAPVLVFEALARAVVDLQILRQHDDLIRGDPLAEATIDQYRDRFLESAVELRANDPSVRANHAAKEILKDEDFPVPPTNAEKLQAIGQFVQDNARGVLSEQMQEDAETACDGDEPDENRKSAILRFGKRVADMLILDRQSVQDMAAVATLIEFSRAHGLVDALAALIRIFLKQ